MENNENKKLNQKELKKIRSEAMISNPLCVVACLLVFWPGGLYCMWRYKVFNLPIRIIISILISVLVTIKILDVIISYS